MLFKLAKETRLPIAYDDAPQEKAVIQELLARARPRPQTKIVRFAEKSVATTKLLNGLKHNTLVHWTQEPLDAAARTAVIRMSGKTRLFGIPENDPTADITGIDASALAVQALPPVREKVGVVVVD